MELELTQEDLARITDTTHKIQSAEEALTPIDPRKIPGLAEIRACLQKADKTLRGVVRSCRQRMGEPEMGGT
jgi:hypothetical protein